MFKILPKMVLTQRVKKIIGDDMIGSKQEPKIPAGVTDTMLTTTESRNLKYCTWRGKLILSVFRDQYSEEWDISG